ncbi:MAG: alanine racemase [Actinomycetota bacterium]|jgi:alanine racemase|nr:alanine racemase [Actinomycetota bacterium]
MSERAAWAEVDLGAIAANATTLAVRAAPAALCAVVKANGYGHGATAVARAALEGGATWLAVALTAEGAELRDAGISAPILLLSEPPTDEHADVVRFDLTPTVYTEDGIESLARAARGALGVHLKIDTGMHRVGVAPGAAVALAKFVLAHRQLRLDGVWTHVAVADEPGHPATAVQHERFVSGLADLHAAGIDVPLAHVANSAATIDQPSLHHDLVRCGIALYGLDPSPQLAGRVALRPAMRLVSRVSHVQVVPAGDAVSYGLRRALTADSVVATVPIGYADGVPRRLFDVGAELLVGGKRRPIAGVITMDQLMVDCGDDEVRRGDEVVLIGEQGSERVGAEEWAALLGTISYEIVCGISSRVPRRYVG